MNMMIVPGEGYIPTYTRTDLTDALHNTFEFRTDYQITSQQNMRKVFNQTKNKTTCNQINKTSQIAIFSDL